MLLLMPRQNVAKGPTVRLQRRYLALTLPLAAFAILKFVPGLEFSFGSGTSHFHVVTLVSALAFIMAGAVVVAAATTPSARIVFLALGFLAMSGIFLAHGLGTSPYFGAGHGHSAPAAPAETEHSYGDDASAAATTAPAPINPTLAARMKVVGYSAQFSLLACALMFALAVASLPAAIEKFVIAHRIELMLIVTALLGAYMTVALFFPELIAPIPLDNSVIRFTVMGATLMCFAFAAWRFEQAHELAMLPLQGAMAAGAVLLMQAQIAMFYGEVFNASWWIYHFAMLAGFLLCVVALIRQRLVTGDLGAIVEGLFLRDQVKGMRTRDPRAMKSLAVAVAAKDSETAGHIDRVGDLTVVIGGRMGVPRRSMETLRWAGRMHDVGKIGVPNRILQKAGPLTKEEFETVKLHTIRGWQIARNSEMLAAVAPVIRAHHERLDGSGYPDGLKGDEIPMEARIVAVADVWDALTCDRPYRRAMSWQQAAEILSRDAGKHLDPDCIDALFAVLGLPDLSRIGDLENWPAIHRRAA